MSKYLKSTDCDGDILLYKLTDQQYLLHKDTLAVIKEKRNDEIVESDYVEWLTSKHNQDVVYSILNDADDFEEYLYCYQYSLAEEWLKLI